MLENPRSLLPVLLAIFIGGCAAGVGTRFVRPEPESLKNGQTRYAQIIERFGIPFQKGTLVKNEKTIEYILFLYFNASAGWGMTGVRSLRLFFFNDVLVGHRFTSSRLEDDTDFDDSKINQIVIGKSTRAEVLALLGRPGGFYIYPAIKSQSGEAAVYSKISQPSRNVFTEKSLIVTFDPSGLVTDLEYFSSKSDSNDQQKRSVGE